MMFAFFLIVAWRLREWRGGGFLRIRRYWFLVTFPGGSIIIEVI